MKQQATTSPKTTSKPKAAVDPGIGAGALRRNPQLDGALAFIDFVLAYLFFTAALDTGSLLQYAVAFLALGLGIRSTTSVIRAIRRGKA